jgi:hypothetical protein
MFHMVLQIRKYSGLFQLTEAVAIAFSPWYESDFSTDRFGFGLVGILVSAPLGQFAGRHPLGSHVDPALHHSWVIFAHLVDQ